MFIQILSLIYFIVIYCSTKLQNKFQNWKEKYNALRLQHISDEAEIQELNDRLEQCFEEISLVKSENTHLQVRVAVVPWVVHQFYIVVG